jgi:hypothetical protein
MYLVCIYLVIDEDSGGAPYASVEFELSDDEFLTL